MDNRKENQPKCDRKRCFWSLGIFFVLALAVRISYYCFRDRLHRDAYNYIDFARDLVASGWDWSKAEFAEYMEFPPLMTILHGAMIEMGFSPKVGGAAVCIFFGALLPLGVYILARQLFRERLYAEIAALIAILHPRFVDVSATVLRDPLYLTFFTFTLALGVYIAKNGRSVWWWSLYGLLAGLSSISRKEGLELIAIALLWLVAEIFFRRELPLGKRLLRAVWGGCLILGVALIVLVPVIIWTGFRPGVILGKCYITL